jgi:uncharacterized protein YbjT (DUF2867 family)
MIVLMGASGNVGEQTAHLLLGKGIQLRVIGRKAERLRALAERGAEVAVGSILDEDFLTRCFSGAEAVFVISPMRYDTDNLRAWYRHCGETFVQALRGAAVRHVLHLSCLGAASPEAVGPAKGMQDQEKLLNTLNCNVLHLRPACFMENLYTSIPKIRKNGIMTDAFKADLPFAMIATRDIAAIAADALLKRNFSGIQIRELLGQRDVSMLEVARVIGLLLGKPELTYAALSCDDMREELRQAGIAENPAREMVALAKAINEKKIAVGCPRSRVNTTPTSIEAFAATFASVYSAS